MDTLSFHLELLGICGDLFDENVYFLMDCLDKFVYLVST